MRTQPTAAELVTLALDLPTDALISDPADLAPYAHGGSPLAAVLPRTTSEVQATLAWATRCDIPVVVRGGGTRMNPDICTDGALVLSTERMTSIRVDAAGARVLAQAGARMTDVAAAAAARGLYLAAGPITEDGTVGGEIATDVAGTGAARYGSLCEDLLDLGVVLPEGAVLRVSTGAGADDPHGGLARLFPGSEGLLAVITEVAIALMPAEACEGALLAAFDSAAVAAGAALDIAAAVRPSVLDMIDRTTLASMPGVPDAAGAPAVLIVRCDSASPDGTSPTARIEAIVRRHGATATRRYTDKAEVEAILGARRSVLPTLEARGVTGRYPMIVPVPRLAEFCRRVPQVEKAYGVTVALAVRVAQGVVHAFVIGDEAAAVDDVLAELFDLAEPHPAGTSLAPGQRSWRARSAAARASTKPRMKVVVDPKGLLNPGLVF
jgi:glycolate oxidase